MRRGASLPARWRESKPLRQKAGTVCGFAATVFFALYNGGLGLYHSSLWHGSICLYYLLLSLLRGLLLVAKYKRDRAEHTAPDKQQRRILSLSSAMLLLLNLSLAAPLALMVLDRRPVHTSLIPAIATATYTTYKIAAASVKLKGRAPDPLARRLRLLGFVDALVSILVLQNTLITVIDGGVTHDMFYLSALSSAAIFLVILALSLRQLLPAPKED